MSTDGGSSYTNYDNAIVLNSACGWSYQWTNLPQYTEEGQSILYRADETTPKDIPYRAPQYQEMPLTVTVSL